MIKLYNYLPRILPAGWRKSNPPKNFAAIYPTGNTACYLESSGIVVLISIDDYGPVVGSWLHVSISRGFRYPSWNEIKSAKELFIGVDKVAIQILPGKKDYLNVHENCFHLWYRIDGETIPEELYKQG